MINESNVKEKGFISVDAVKNNNEKCPHCGNKIFWTYGSVNGVPATIKCSFCGHAYDNNGNLFFVERL